MASSQPLSVYPTYVAEGRFTTVDDQHQAASAYILSILCLVYSGLVLFLRGHLRWGMFGADDYLTAIATIFQGGEVAAILVALLNGVGTSFELLDNTSLQYASKATMAGSVMFIAVACLAKSSVIMLTLRLFNLIGDRSTDDSASRLHRMLCFSALGLCALWGVGSIIALTANCSASTFINSSISAQTCPSQTTRWAVIMAFDVVTECLLVGLAVAIVLPIRMSIKMKTPVIAAFAFRLPCAGLSIIHFHFVNNYINDNPNGLRIVPMLNIMQVQLCWSLVSATIPILKAFVRSFNSGLGLGLDIETAYGGSGGYGYANGSKIDYELTHIKQSMQRSQNQSHTEPEPVELADDQSTVRDLSRPSHEQGNNIRKQTLSLHEQEGSVTSGGSQEQIIRKDVHWRVTYEDHHAQ